MQKYVVVLISMHQSVVLHAKSYFYLTHLFHHNTEELLWNSQILANKQSNILNGFSKWKAKCSQRNRNAITTVRDGYNSHL